MIEIEAQTTPRYSGEPAAYAEYKKSLENRIFSNFETIYETRLRGAPIGINELRRRAEMEEIPFPRFFSKYPELQRLYLSLVKEDGYESWEVRGRDDDYNHIQDEDFVILYGHDSQAGVSARDEAIFQMSVWPDFKVVEQIEDMNEDFWYRRKSPTPTLDELMFTDLVLQLAIQAIIQK